MLIRDPLLHLFARRRWRGFETLYRLTGGGDIIAPNCYGTRFALNPHDYVENVTLRDGYYESEVFEAIHRQLTAGTVFWDVGSCFGLHAVTAAALVPGLQAIAFEPNPTSQARLRRNAALNRVPVRLLPCALHDTEGSSILYVPGPGNAGMATLCAENRSVGATAISAPIARADALVATGVAPAPHIVKIDVEGNELAALRGFGSLLKGPTLRAIVLEADPAILRDDVATELRQLLLDAGFALEPLRRREATQHALINVLALRS